MLFRQCGVEKVEYTSCEMTLGYVAAAGWVVPFLGGGKEFDFLFRLRAVSEDSFHFTDEITWTEASLRDLLFTLNESKFAECSGSVSHRVPVLEDMALYDSLLFLSRDGMMEDVSLRSKGFVQSDGTDRGLNVALLMQRVKRVWSTRKDDFSGRPDVGNGILLLREAPISLCL